MRPGFLLSNRCACQGCAGKPKGLGPGPARPPHAGRCDKPRRSEPEYGPFCKVCYRHYLCTHCGERAVDPEAEPEDHTLRGVCSACVGSREAWCECPGCGEGDARHVHHSDSGANCARPRDRHRGAHNFCASCRRAWRCASCQREVTVCPEWPTGPRCSACIGPSPPAFLEDYDVPGVLLAQRCLCTKADRCEHGPYLCAHVKSEGPETHGLCVACLEHSTCECGPASSRSGRCVLAAVSSGKLSTTRSSYRGGPPRAGARTQSGRQSPARLTGTSAPLRRTRACVRLGQQA